MDYVFGALAVFWIWHCLSPLFEAPEWAWNLGVTALAIGAQLLVSSDEWYWGLAIAGLALVFRRIADLLLLLADRAMLTVLRTTRRT